MSSALSRYLQALVAVRGSGVAETSGYAALHALLEEVGASLKPQVRCILHPKSVGAGIVDAGLFTAEQFPKEGGEPGPQVLPARGVVEVKPVGEDVEKVAAGAQVAKYAEAYGLVLVTNYRDFIVVAQGPDDAFGPREGFSLAPDESGFWALAAHPASDHAKRQGVALEAFLARALTRTAPLQRPEDVAVLLAAYAKQALARVEGAPTEALHPIRDGLEQSLGIRFAGEPGDHFFRSTLVQTLFYGIFSAWVLWRREQPPGSTARFDWRTAGFNLHVPVLQALFGLVAAPHKLKPLGLGEVLDWTAEALHRIDWPVFNTAFRESEAVQYFYEPFLEAFDPALRREMGVWYTPSEIVEYMVERVDQALREDLDIPDGLADPRVVVLDPCCGTGAYVVEVLHRIHRTLQAKGEGGLAAAALKQAATTRVFGFEILTAPFVIAHMQVGMYLRESGAPLNEDKERAAVYLTNALTGWAPPKGPKAKFLFPELEAEKTAADAVKRDQPILVVLGNPPYRAFQTIAMNEEELESLAAYREGLAEKWGISKNTLNDLYIRFFRVAERRITEGTGRGIVCFISNFSYLGGASFVMMRERWLTRFDRVRIDNLNGDMRTTHFTTPSGDPDHSVFTTGRNVGIRVGTAIALLLRRGKSRGQPAHGEVWTRDFWGTSKRTDLLNSLRSQAPQLAYERVSPQPDNYFSFRPETVSAAYRAWPRVTELAAVAPFNGPVERRGGSLLDIDKAPLQRRIKAYFDKAVTDEQVKSIHPGLMMTGNRIVGPEARKKIRREARFSDKRIVRYPFKPFDVRWCYWDNIRPLFSEPSPYLLEQSKIPGNRFFLTRNAADKAEEGIPFLFSSAVCDYDCLSGHARHFPVWLRNGDRLDARAHQRVKSLFGDSPNEDCFANLSALAREYLARLGFGDPDQDQDTAEVLWFHALAVGCSAAYLKENADGIRQDWPRIPLPATRAALEASAALGRRVAALLEPEAPVDGVTRGPLRPELAHIAVPQRADGGPLNPAKDCAVTAGWGRGGGGEPVMPGRGKMVERDYSADELPGGVTSPRPFGPPLSMDGEGPLSELSLRADLSNSPSPSMERGTGGEVGRDQYTALLGATTRDVYLNDEACWANVPEAVWNFTIGGYQVLKKWLSYREQPILGRPLDLDELRHFRDTARRIAALLLLGPELDDNYEAAKDQDDGLTMADDPSTV